MTLAKSNKDASFELFCSEFVKITTKIPGECIPLVFNAIQRLFCEHRTGRDIVCKYRQAGFTTLELARDLWFCLVQAYAAVAVVTQPHKTNEPSKKVIAQLEFIIEHLGVEVGAQWSGGTVTFSNGSRLTVFDAGGSTAAAKKQGRGGTYHRAHITELAYFPFAVEVANALDAAVPTPEQGGEVVEESTADGAHGLFYEHYQGAEAHLNGLDAHFYGWFLQEEYRSGTDTAPALPANNDEKEVIDAAKKAGVTLTVAQLTWWRQQCSKRGFNKTLQEYPHTAKRAFIAGGTTYFDNNSLNELEKKCGVPLATLKEKTQALAEELNKRDLALRVWEEPIPFIQYIISVDTAGGKQGEQYNWCVAQVYRKDTKQHVATLREQRHPSEFARRLAKLGKLYNTAKIAVERNNHGGTVITTLEETEKYPALWRDAKGEIGWHTHTSNRTAIIDELVDAVTSGLYPTQDIVFVQEARSFVRHDDGSISAANGAQDDMILCAAIGWKIISTARAMPSFVDIHSERRE